MEKILVILISVLLIVGCGQKEETITTDVPDSSNTSTDVGCGTDDSGCEVTIDEGLKQYKELISNFKEVSYDEAYEMLNNGSSFVLYYGFKTCPWCQELIPFLAEYTKYIDIYYVDQRPDGEDSRKEEHPLYESYLKNYEIINEFAETDKIYAPTVINVIDGEIISIHTGTVEGHDAHERKMTDEEKELLRAQLDEMMADAEGMELWK